MRCAWKYTLLWMRMPDPVRSLRFLPTLPALMAWTAGGQDLTDPGQAVQGHLPLH
ncbi:hypothetical protein [Streptomyces sp. NPDC056948]|uniref:hypothetical protein n=1 Tax=Streptomyces sp. NPDC056948 TaxID=3345975 RepID=UPI00362E1931